jgi:hypothetical protein
MSNQHRADPCRQGLEQIWRRPELVGLPLGAFSDKFGRFDVFGVRDTLRDLLIDARTEGSGHLFGRIRIIDT